MRKGVRNGFIRNAVREKGKLNEDQGHRCAKYVRGCCPEGSADEQGVVLEDGSSLECMNRFCYLGDMLGAAGGVERRLGLESEGLGDSSRSLQSC